MGMAGKMVHLEIGAADADRATSFYREVFGWQFGDSGMPGIDYRMARLDEQAGAAIFPSEDAGKGRLVYIDTDDIDGSLGKVGDSGGKSDGKRPDEAVRWFLHAPDA